MLRLWLVASTVAAGWHMALLVGLFGVLFCVARYESDSDRDMSAVLDPGRLVMERVLLQPVGLDRAEALGGLGWLANTAVWGVAGGSAVVLTAAMARLAGSRRGRAEPGAAADRGLHSDL